MTSAVARRRQQGSLAVVDASTILGQLDVDFVNELIVINVSGRLIELAAALVDKHGLRAYDGVHLAASLKLNQVRLGAGLSATTLVSSDGDLNSAARAEGLTVEKPNDHP